MGKRILVIDDDRAVLTTLEFLLKRAGHETTCVAEISKAFALAEAESFDLLISDLVMPEEDGVAVIGKFRALFPAMPIVAVSGGARLGTPDTLATARAAGADALLQKPFTMETLAAALTAALSAASGKNG